MNASSNASVANYFQNVIENQAARNSPKNLSHLTPLELAKKRCYIRIGEKGFRLVSLSERNPCGKLDSRPFGKFTSVNRRLERLKELHQPGNSKPEQRLQAYLIYQLLLQRPEQSAKLLNPDGSLIDALWFVADELRLGDTGVRADMLLVGVRKGKYFPILAELKAKRDLGKVAKQLENFHRIAQDNKREFSSLVQQAMPQEVGGVLNFNAIQKWVVWPASKSGRSRRSTLDRLKAGSLIAVELDSSVDLSSHFPFDKKLSFNVLQT